jgi:hypothetical protein
MQGKPVTSLLKFQRLSLVKANRAGVRERRRVRVETKRCTIPQVPGWLEEGMSMKGKAIFAPQLSHAPLDLQ